MWFEKFRWKFALKTKEKKLSIVINQAINSVNQRNSKRNETFYLLFFERKKVKNLLTNDLITLEIILIKILYFNGSNNINWKMLNLEDYLGRKEYKPKIENTEFKMDSIMNRLPNELFSKILEYLNFNDYVRLSRVSKRWNSIVQIKTNRYNELAIFLYKNPKPEKMYFTNKIISYSNTVCLQSLYCLFFEDFKEKFKDIKYLMIVNNFDDDIQATKIDFNDNILNYFSHLRHMELRNIQQIRGKLRYIKFHLLSNYKFEIHQ